MMDKAWAYIAHKDGYWAGVASATLSSQSLAEFMREFLDDGFSIMAVASRDEYDTALNKLGFWHDSPEFKAKNPSP